MLRVAVRLAAITLLHLVTGFIAILITSLIAILIAILIAVLIAILIDVVLVTSYCTTPPPFRELREQCHQALHHIRRVLLAIIFVASYSPSYSSRLTRHDTRRVLLAIILVAESNAADVSQAMIAAMDMTLCVCAVDT
jgi:hypothetical protein